MEARLKKQRNRLFLRVSLILFAVWLLISAVYCAIRIQAEKNNIQSRELSALSNAKQMLSVEDSYNGSHSERAFMNLTDLFQPVGSSRSESQIIVTDKARGEVVTDTAGKLGVRYNIRISTDSSGDVAGFLDYKRIRSSLSKKQLGTIKRYLKKGSEGEYELICTRFHILYMELVPTELKIVAPDREDSRNSEEVETLTLADNMPDEDVFESSQIRRNKIPKSFILDGEYNRDLISDLSEKDKKEAVAFIPTGGLSYIFYATDYLNVSGETDDSQSSADGLYTIQYARAVDLLSSCRRDLFVGVAVIFCFFLTIAVLLCVMFWKTVRTQLIQEQKRLDLTNALAHDIKTPLFVISGCSYSLLEDIDGEERDEYLGKIIEQTDEINSLVHNMLNLSKLDSYKMTLNRGEVDLCGLVEEIIGDYKALPEGKKLSFSHSGDNIASADRELLKTAFKNLIDNAVRYSLPESEIRVSLLSKSLTIENECEPLTKSELRQIWEPYVRKDKSRNKKGNGLGLSIVKSILDLHGAKYSMEMNGKVLACRIELG